MINWIKINIIVNIVFFMTYILTVMSVSLSAQISFKFNALVDIELSKAGEDSHYYYNEIDNSKTDYRVGFSQANLIGKLKFHKNWSVNTRLLLERNKGKDFSNFLVPELNIQWLSKKRKLGFTIGSFVNPFGAYNERQLSIKKNFIGLPLAYSYYTNISPKIGFVQDMGDKVRISIDGRTQWGSSVLYYGGYTVGAMMSWNIIPSKVVWKLALVNGAVNQQTQFTDPINWGIISRLKLQPTYFWEQGISVSHGTFMQDSEVSWLFDNSYNYSQTLIGTDFKLGSGYFELSGEVNSAFYRVPYYITIHSHLPFVDIDLYSFSGYVDIKYEFPILSGSYIAYRIDHLGFGGLNDLSSQSWDNNVQRHSLAFGYHINKYILARFAASTQHVDNKSWDKTQRTFRFVLTAHY